MKVLSIYFNGTDEPNTINTHGSLANVLYDITKNNTEDAICLSGCAINNPHTIDSNGIFAYNLSTIVDDTVKKIESRISSEGSLTLNLYGFSRGACGILMIAKRLAQYDPSVLTINMAVFEPVSGNFMAVAISDVSSSSKLTISGEVKICVLVKILPRLYFCIPKYLCLAFFAMRHFFLECLNPPTLE